MTPTPDQAGTPGTPGTPAESDWTSASFDGNRLRQHRAFLALPLREKLDRIEEMGEVARALGGARHASRRPRPRGGSAGT